MILNGLRAARTKSHQTPRPEIHSPTSTAPMLTDHPAPAV